MKKLVILILLLIIAINGFSIVKSYKFNIEKIYYNTKYDVYMWCGYIEDRNQNRINGMVFNFPKYRPKLWDKWIKNKTYRIVTKIDKKNNKIYSVILYSFKKVDIKIEELLLDENGI